MSQHYEQLAQKNTEAQILIQASNEAQAFSKDNNRNQAILNFKESLSNIGDRNLMLPPTHTKLHSHLIKNIQNKTPFSLIRLGDGEGNILFWNKHKQSYPILAELSMNRILRLMFGQKSPPKEHWDKLGNLMSAAVKNAVYIGIPTDLQTTNAFEALKEAKPENFDLRGMSGAAAVWDWLSEDSKEWLSSQERIIINCHVHTSLINFACSLAQEAKSLSLITCYPELMPAISKSFNISSAGRIYLIPPQAVNIKGTPSEQHYPHVFEKIIESLKKETNPGDLYFVGAGVLGKIYCETIRAAGGMSIDVGSMMDVWLGKGVRGYQNQEYLDKHTLK